MMLRHLYRPLLLLATLALPALAWADNINPSGGNAWDLYVYGNGEAIAQILTAIKLTIAPDHGGSSFRLLLLFLATAGFVTMAVRAGFDPAKNLLRMFAFILVVWMVTYSTQTARSNIHVYDRFTNYSNVVAGVPALVGVPAAIVSQVGEFLTQSIEQNFSLPNGADSSSMNLSNGGPYNLFAKVMSDADKFTITDPDLRRSVTAYVSDCGVTAVALGNLGVNELMNSTNLMETLAKAKSQAIMTRYYPMQQPVNANGTGTGGGFCMAPAGSTIGGGNLLTCEQAYTCLQIDTSTYAQALSDATSAAWTSNGVAVPFEGAMSSALAMSAAAGNASTYSSPEGFILQKTMTSSMSGAFRDAAARTGNNELMMATSIAQAEQSQRTSWWTASEIFKNMMGYVFTVLQAFIFAMVPVIVICLMIPGMGGKIFINYAQIMVWLTLWAPMLAIVNFLVEIFGSSQMQTSLGAQGLTMNNSALISEQANNLVIVAQFMGTLVPIMTWGLVKGAMAFTEFISHGIGSSFATQAGAQAATGNVSMGNLSLGNVGMDKYSTAMTSNVGFQEVKADHGAGAGTGAFAEGGASQTIAGHNATVSRNASSSVSWTDSNGGSHSASLGEAHNIASQTSQAAQRAQSYAQSWGKMQSEANDIGKSLNANDSWAHDWQNKVDRSLSAAKSLADSEAAAASGGVSGSTGKGVGASGSADYTTRSQAAQSLENSMKELLAEGRSHAKSVSSGSSASQRTGDSTNAGTSGGISFSDSKGESVSDSWSKAASTLDSVSRNWSSAIQESVSASQTTAVSFGGGGKQTPTEADMRHHQDSAGSAVAQGESAFGVKPGAADTHIASTRSQIGGQTARDGAGVQGLQEGAAARNVTAEGTTPTSSPLDAGQTNAALTGALGSAPDDYSKASDKVHEHLGQNLTRLDEGVAYNFVSGRRLDYNPINGTSGSSTEAIVERSTFDKVLTLGK